MWMVSSENWYMMEGDLKGAIYEIMSLPIFS